MCQIDEREKKMILSWHHYHWAEAVRGREAVCPTFIFDELLMLQEMFSTIYVYALLLHKIYDRVNPILKALWIKYVTITHDQKDWA